MLAHTLAIAAIALGPDPDIVTQTEENARLLEEATGLQANVSPTLDTLTSALTRVSVQDADGDFKSFVGLLVEQDLIATMWYPLPDAHSGTATIACCEQAEIVGVVAAIPSLNLALLAIERPIPAHDSVDDPEPLELAPAIPLAGEPAHLIARLPLELDGSVATARYDRTVISRRRWHALPHEFLRINFDIDDTFGGAVLADQEDRPYAITTNGAGANKLFASPLAPLMDAPRHEPVPLDAYTYDTLPDSAKALHDEQTAEFARNENDLRGAERLARRAIALDPDRWLAHYTLGVILDMTRRPDDALASLRESIRLEPGWSESEYSLGLVLLTLERPAEAVPHFRRSTTLDPDYDHAHAMLGIAHLHAGDPRRALAGLRRAHELTPDDEQFAGNLAIGLTHAGRESEIPDVWRAVTAAAPDNAHAWDQLGSALIDLDEFAPALEALLRSQELDPVPDATRLLRIVICHQTLGDIPSAYAALDEAETAAPDHPVVSRVRALLERDHPRQSP